MSTILVFFGDPDSRGIAEDAQACFEERKHARE